MSQEKTYSEVDSKEIDPEVANKMLAEYPNLQMMLAGCVSGHYTEWPMMRAELKRLLASFNSSSNITIYVLGELLESYNAYERIKQIYMGEKVYQAKERLANAHSEAGGYLDQLKKLRS